MFTLLTIASPHSPPFVVAGEVVLLHNINSCPLFNLLKLVERRPNRHVRPILLRWWHQNHTAQAPSRAFSSCVVADVSLLAAWQQRRSQTPKHLGSVLGRCFDDGTWGKLMLSECLVLRRSRVTVALAYSVKAGQVSHEKGHFQQNRVTSIECHGQTMQ